MTTHLELVRRLRAVAMKGMALEFTLEQCTRDLESILKTISLLVNGGSVQCPSSDQTRIGRFVVDRATFSVTDGIHVCALGNTICFRFVQCLASEPNRYFTLDELLGVVWHGQRRTATTVRSAVFELRAQFRKTGMEDFANAIHSKGHAYGLRIDTRTRASQRKSNGKPT